METSIAINKDPETATKTDSNEIILSVINNSYSKILAPTESITTHSVSRPQIYTDFSPRRSETLPNDGDRKNPSENTLQREESFHKDVESEVNTAQLATEQNRLRDNMTTVEGEPRPQIYTNFNPSPPQRSVNTSPESTTSQPKDSKNNFDGDLLPQIFGGYSPTRPVQYNPSPSYLAAQRPQSLAVVGSYNPSPPRSDNAFVNSSVSSPDSMDGSVRTGSIPSTPLTNLRVNENLQESFPTPPPPYSALDTSSELNRNVITTQPQISYVNRDGLQKGIIYSARPRTLACPYCLRQVLTNHKKEIGMKVHLVGIGCLLLGCMPLCVLAYVTDYLKDDNHYCPSCGRMIGTEVPVPN